VAWRCLKRFLLVGLLLVRLRLVDRRIIQRFRRRRRRRPRARVLRCQTIIALWNGHRALLASASGDYSLPMMEAVPGSLSTVPDVATVGRWGRATRGVIANWRKVAKDAGINIER
jgi:hypothetical protein